MIEIKNLNVHLLNKPILRNVTFNIKDNNKYAILGFSGSGKSVLLRTILGLLKPTSGEIIMDGINVHDATDKEQLQLRSNLGFLFQNSALFDFMNVGANVAFPLIIHDSLSEKEISMRVNESLEMVGLQDSNEKMPDELSGGMQKRVALARAIIRKPKYLFYDEPTSGLDPVNGKLINTLIGKLNKDLGLTSITVTHDMSALDEISERVLFLSKQGELIFEGSNDSMRKSKMLKQFFRGEDIKN